MPFITFIYKIGKRRFYGKYVYDCVSDDHEGLDMVIEPIVQEGINLYRQQQGLPPCIIQSVGILSLSVDGFVPCYSSEKEQECFDFYAEESGFYKYDFYVNGKKIVNN